jgi:hypothetical protein
LNVRSAVASAGKLEVAGADCAYLFEELQNFFALHGVCCRGRMERGRPRQWRIA